MLAAGALAAAAGRIRLTLNSIFIHQEPPQAPTAKNISSLPPRSVKPYADLSTASSAATIPVDTDEDAALIKTAAALQIPCTIPRYDVERETPNFELCSVHVAEGANAIAYIAGILV